MADIIAIQVADTEYRLKNIAGTLLTGICISTYLEVPAVIEEATSNAVQGLLKSRNPKCVAPRVVNGPTMLAGVARCGYCGAALIQNTGKGGAYRYCCCSRKLKEGVVSCRGIRMPMQKLDELVVEQVAEKVLAPNRLATLLETYLQSSNERADRHKHEIDRLRHLHRDTQVALARLITLVENGLMEAEDPTLKERLPASSYSGTSYLLKFRSFSAASIRTSPRLLRPRSRNSLPF